MATTTSITSTYAGEFAGDYIAAALLSGETINSGAITVKPNVKYKQVVKKIGTDDIVRDAVCDFTPTSTVTLTERILQPEYQQVNLQLCKKEFIEDWEAESMGYSAHHNLPSKFSDFLLAHVADKVAQRTENSIWAGDTSNNGQFDGLITKFKADSDVIDRSATTVTSSNVIDEMGKLIDSCPSAIYNTEDLTLYMSRNISKAYIRALGGFGANGLGAAGTNDQGSQWYNNGSLSFEGVKIFVAPGLTDNTAVLAQKSNLYFGTGLLADHNEVKVLDMADLDGSDNVRVVMRFTAGVQYGIGSEIVLYEPTV